MYIQYQQHTQDCQVKIFLLLAASSECITKHRYGLLLISIIPYLSSDSHTTCSCFLLSIFLLPHSQQYPQTQKKRPTRRSSEPLQVKNPLILSHLSILSSNHTTIPMTSILNSRLWRYATLRTFSPGVKMFPLRQIYPTGFDIRQIKLSAWFCAESG